MLEAAFFWSKTLKVVVWKSSADLWNPDLWTCAAQVARCQEVQGGIASLRFLLLLASVRQFRLYQAGILSKADNRPYPLRTLIQIPLRPNHQRALICSPPKTAQFQTWW